MEYSGYSTTGPFGIAQSLVGYWPFDEGSGTVAHDESGYGNNGTIYSVQWVIGRVENALLFRGGYVGVPNSGSLQISGGITVEAWVKRDTIGRIDGLLLKRSGEAGFGMNIHSAFGDKIIFYTGKTSYGGLIGNTKIQAGQWYHIAGVYDNAVGRKIYVNGELDASDSVSGQLGANTAWLNIGQYTSSYPFSGIIDEVRIYNRALSENQFKQH